MVAGSVVVVETKKTPKKKTKAPKKTAKQKNKTTIKLLLLSDEEKNQSSILVDYWMQKTISILHTAGISSPRKTVVVVVVTPAILVVVVVVVLKCWDTDGSPFVCPRLSGMVLMATISFTNLFTSTVLDDEPRVDVFLAQRLSWGLCEMETHCPILFRWCPLQTMQSRSGTNACRPSTPN